MKVGSLFSGIGGLDLGLERAGMSVAWQCESDPYCRAVLRKHWPDVPCYEDVRDVTGDASAVDLICGGFPCQPVSFAGKGLAQADERWLWPEFIRIVRTLRPRYVLVENVPGLLARGMGIVLGDLAASGYDAEWDCVSAASVGAPHLRRRIFVVGYANGVGRMGGGPALEEGAGLGTRARMDAGAAGDEVAHPESRQQEQSEGADAGPLLGAGTRAGSGVERGNRPAGGRFNRRVAADGSTILADPVSEPVRVRSGRVEGAPRTGEGEGPERERVRPDALDGSSGVGDVAYSEREPAGGGSDGPQRRERSSSEAPEDGWTRTSPSDGWWEVEPDVGRVAHGVPSRVDRLRALGNAVVPQVAEFVGRHIMSLDGAA